MSEGMETIEPVGSEELKSVAVVENGVARVKPEYIITDHERKLALNCISQEDKLELGEIEKEEAIQNENCDEPQCKKAKLSKSQKRKLSGQNRARPQAFILEKEKNLCFTLTDVLASGGAPGKCTKPNCPFLHNIEEYLSVKPPDVGPTCYIYSVQGHCPRGVTCRFAKHHLTPEGKNIVDSAVKEAYLKNGLNVKNSISHELQRKLRKWEYDFKKSNIVIERVTNVKPNQKDNSKQEVNSESNTAVSKDAEGTDVSSATADLTDNANSTEKNIGPVADNDIILTRSSEKVVIDWKDKLYLSPLTTVGNLPFRRICKEYGVDITCGEMAMADSLLRGMPTEWALVKRHSSEDLFGVQVCGNNPQLMTKCAQLLEENTEINFIDINLGCPIELVYRKGQGSGLLLREKQLRSVVQGMSQVLSIPLTVKTRTGVYTNKNIAHQLAPKFREWGASLITVHGRSREQRYTKHANWPYVEECAQQAGSIPVFLNGDILSYQDYERARRECPSVAGVMIGRGSLIKPWVFTEIKEHRDWDISSAERFEMLKRYVNYGLEHWGSDTKGVENTRKFLLEWLSFLYRYIPVALLECPPQRVNDRPPYYRGRDDLETLMASPNCADWLKISEMLLGPVPPNYNFLPKHKANSWK